MRSGKPLGRIIRDTKRTDFYLDAPRARDYGLIDRILVQDALVAESRAERVAVVGTPGETETPAEEPAREEVVEPAASENDDRGRKRKS